MAGQTPRSEIHTKLNELVRGLGARQPGLYKRLGTRLRHVWKVRSEDEDNPERVFRIVQWQLERLIQASGKNELAPRDKVIARVSFNISILGIEKKDLTRRREWLEEQDFH